uniref:Uncharacterized protein n=1 Tax=Anguilla anguilla TaxID=7936 RepID=A0A0E9RUP1_ANGAN
MFAGKTRRMQITNREPATFWLANQFTSGLVLFVESRAICSAVAIAFVIFASHNLHTCICF